jgi:hypothetical protein
MVVVGAIGLGVLLYPAPLLGWDWYHTLQQGGDIDFWYPGWTKLLVSPLAGLPWRWGLAFSNGLMLAAVSIATFHESRDRWGYVAAVMAVVSAPVATLLWAGNVDGWMLLGYLALPWGVPLLLIKPTIGIFALLARKSWFIAGGIFGILSILIWGWWPVHAIGIHVTGGFIHTSSSMGWYLLGWPILILGIGMLLYSNRKDPLQLMAAGSFVMPYVFPYHFVLLLPALGRFQHFRQLILWIISWTLMLSFALGINWAWTGYFFPFAVWWMLRNGLNPEDTWLAELKRGSASLLRKLKKERV